MKKKRVPRIILTVCAVFAAAVLFVTYGTVLPAAPFASIQLDGPVAVDSDGSSTVVVDSGSRRALILNADNDLTGVVGCTTIDSPFDAITDACVVDGLVYLSGVSFVPDSEMIAKERVAVYDKGGNRTGVVFEKPDINSVVPTIKSLSNASEGIVVSYEVTASQDSENPAEGAADGNSGENGSSTHTALEFDLVAEGMTSQLRTVDANEISAQSAAYAASDDGNGHFAILSVLGTVGDGVSGSEPKLYPGHVFTAIDIDNGGTLYACDDETGALCTIAPGSSSVRMLVPGEGYHSVHENGGTISVCNAETGAVTLCDASGTVSRELTEVKPSMGFSVRMMLVWASGLYLGILALVLIVKTLFNRVREGKTEGIGPMFLAVAVVSAIAIAIGSLSLSSYEKSIEVRTNEINMSADYLEDISSQMSEPLKEAGNRDALRGSGKNLIAAAFNFIQAIEPVSTLVSSANGNGIGMYYNLYGKDDRGIYYLYGSADEYVMGTSARQFSGVELDDAFEKGDVTNHKLLAGRTLRDETQYRLVQISSPNEQDVIGVIEIGSKMRSYESSIAGDLAQRILALIVMVLVVYLTYSELRACVRCLFAYRQHQQQNPAEAAAILTRPFTLAITMLSSIDSVMTVLIARDLLEHAGMGASSPLLALPAVMLGIGLVVGQTLYGIAGSKVGLRRLMAGGALAMLLCACLTGAAVVFGGFWLYCAAKFAMSVPFGLLYTMGYSLPRLAHSDDVRAKAAGGVKRTDTSAVALGTVLGGYAAQGLGNGWVYALVAVACVIVVVMALNLLPRGMRPLETMAQPDHLDGHVRDFVKKPATLAIAFLVVLPATVAAGYASFLFPLFSVDLGLEKSDINNIVVVGQLVVYVCIGQIEHAESRWGKWRETVAAIMLLGMVFMLFSVNTTLVWSFAVVALVALFCKLADGWKAIWLASAGEEGVPTGRATGAMFATRSLALVAQPFILGALLGAADSVAVIVIGVFCLLCSATFYLITRNTPLKSK